MSHRAFDFLGLTIHIPDWAPVVDSRKMFGVGARRVQSYLPSKEVRLEPREVTCGSQNVFRKCEPG